MQTLEFTISEQKIKEYVAWAKNNVLSGGKTKEFEFNDIIFSNASHISLIRHASDPTSYIAKLQCDHFERKRK